MRLPLDAALSPDVAALDAYEPLDTPSAPDAFETDAFAGEAVLSSTPTSLDLGNVAMGPEARVWIHDTGTGPATPLSLTLAGPDASSFELARTGCDAELLAGESCWVIVRFLPVTPIVARATLEITGGSASLSIPLRAATHDSGALLVWPTGHDFGVTSLGATSPRVRLQISGPAGAGPLSLSIDGAELAIAPGTDHCSGQFLPAFGGCSVDVTVTPSAVGLRSGFFTASAGTAAGGATFWATGVSP